MLGRGRVYGDLSAEIREHLEEKVEGLVAEGMPRKQAEAKARKQFGNVTLMEERGREEWQWPRLESFFSDLRYGLRMLRKSPGFTAVAVLTLALGIGANTAIFSVVNGVLLRALPFRDASRLVAIGETVGQGAVNPVAYPNYLDWRRSSRSFDDMAAYTDAEFIVKGKDSTDRIFGEQVTSNYFSLLGISASLGRTFLSHENEVPLASPVALISYSLWRGNYAADPEVLGKMIRLNDYEFTIVGVLPRGFRGLSDQADAWIPFMMHDAAWPEVAKFHFVTSRDIHWVRVLGRLKPGVTPDAARAEMETIQARLDKEYPVENKGRGVLLFNMADRIAGGFRAPLLILLGAVAFVLLITCANVANLLLTRAASRDREFALRLALGAGRARLMRQAITEGLIISSAGAALGVLCAGWGLNLLVSTLPMEFPSFFQINVDPAVLIFGAALGVATGIVLGILPGWTAGKENLNETLKEGSNSVSGVRSRKVGAAMVVSEIALTMVLMISAGLLLKSLSRMLSSDLGFRTDHLLTMRFYVPNRKWDGDAKNRFGLELAQHVATQPGVESAAVTFIDPFVWGGIQRGYTVEGRGVVSNAEADQIYYQECGPNYFQTMGIPIIAGRDFTSRDSKDSPLVVIVSESLARRFWPGQNPIGKRLKYGPSESHYPWMPVVGVVRDIKYLSIRQMPDEEAVIYAPLLQSEVIINMSVIVRTKSDPAQMIPSLRAVIQRYAPDVPVYDMATISQRLSENAGETRSYARLLALFALLALLLAAMGTYGVLNQWVQRRTHEIGIRMALGARANAVLKLVVVNGLKLTLAGVGIGIAGALALTQLLSSLLYGISPFDPATYIAVSLLLTGVALAACYVPARRAMRVDPMVALRYE